MVTPEELDSVVDEFTGKTKQILNLKAKEYANDDERMENFITIAKSTKLSPEQVIVVMLNKHVQSITKGVMENNYEWCWKQDSGVEGFKERILDATNYLLLLAARLEEVNQVSDGASDPVTELSECFSPGDRVRIVDTGWAGSFGTVLNFDAPNYVRVRRDGDKKVGLFLPHEICLEEIA